MDIDRAKKIIATLAEGIDPITGEILPQDHVCNQGDVVRAFYTVLQGEDSPKKKKHENSGKRWTEEEDKLLKELFEKGSKKSELQRYFRRSAASIDARLMKLGLIDEKISFWRR